MVSSITVKPVDTSNIKTYYRSSGSRRFRRTRTTQEQKDSVVKKAEQYRQSIKPEPLIITPSGKEQTATLEVNQTSNLGTDSRAVNPNLSTQQFQARLVTQAPQGTVFDGGVNQGTQERNQDQKVFFDLERPKGTYSGVVRNYNPEGLDALRVDKYFDDLYKSSGYQSITRQPDSSFVASQINPTQAGISFVAGFGRSVTYPLFNPVETIKGFGKAITNPTETAQAIKTEAQTNPFGFAGEVYGGTKGIDLISKGIVKAKDYARTYGRTEIPRTEVTTPEVIKGTQEFPYKFQTPEELAQEFKGSSPQVSNVQKLYGKDDPLGFSASPDPLKSNKVLSRGEIGDFTSATSGLYQAPSLSEWFLKIRKGESSQYSILPNIQGKPTINLIKSTDVKTFPRKVVIEATQSKNPLEYLNKYAEKNFKQGESFVSPEFTLGKPESEIILKSGTEFSPFQSLTGEKYFVNIEGRRVPVNAFEGINTNSNPIIKTNIKTAETINKEFAETSRSLSTSINNPNFLSDFVKTSLITKKPKENILTITVPQPPDQVTTTGNVPSTTSPFYSITSTTPFNPSKIYPEIEISGVIKPSSSIPPVTQNPSSIFPTYDLEPISYPIRPRPDPTPKPSPRTPERRRSSTPSITRIITPSETTTPTTPSRIITPPPSRPIIPSTSRTPRITTTPVTYTRFDPLSLRPKRQKTQGFDVYIRRQGKFFKENTQPLTKQSAINFGTYKVGADSSATFKLKSVFGKPTTFLRSGNIQNFYKKGNLFIEKKEKRIKRTSPLELQQITFKGIATNKARSKKIKNIFGGGL